MEFIKVGKNYMIKNGNGRIISEKEKLELENQELIIKDIQSNECQGKTTQKITKNKKRIKKIEEGNVTINIDLEPIDRKKVAKYIKEQTAPIKEQENDIIEETDRTL